MVIPIRFFRAIKSDVWADELKEEKRNMNKSIRINKLYVCAANPASLHLITQKHHAINQRQSKHHQNSSRNFINDGNIMGSKSQPELACHHYLADVCDHVQQ